MRNANVKLILILIAFILAVCLAGLLLGNKNIIPNVTNGKKPSLVITATEGLILPSPETAPAYEVPANTPWLSIRADGFTYAPVPLIATGDYTFTRPDGGYNTLHVTRNSIRMISADCSTQDCVHQGTASLDAMDFRPLGGQIICLPHKLVVELIPDGRLDSIIILEDSLNAP
ncbi:MAG: NusG domain II-containing protein [Clostridia bacterium]|nr:NusG domain II-containing protein [Clostridia bacterium]